MIIQAGNFIEQIANKSETREEAIKNTIDFCIYLCEKNRADHWIGGRCHKHDAESLRALLK
jgi:hypothetical protein